MPAKVWSCWPTTSRSNYSEQRAHHQPLHDPKRSRPKSLMLSIIGLGAHKSHIVSYAQELETEESRCRLDCLLDGGAGQADEVQRRNTIIRSSLH